MLIELGRFDEAKVLLKKILDSDTDNVFLKCFASSNLCAIFDKEGKTKELEAEFKRYVELMAKLPPSYGFTANIESGLTRLANVSEILEKMRSHSPTQSFLAEKKSKMKLPSNLTADKIIGDTIQEINNIPGIGSFK
ncbi:hypothetical protein HYY75_05925 [bacterium]|nr:hypothetical protein [bacterium]